MINIISTFNELFAFKEKEKNWFTMLAFIYVRVAAPAGSSSLVGQRNSLISYAERLGLKHVFILEVAGSARHGQKKFEKMIEFYEKETKVGSCPILIVERLDRLTRDLQDTANLYSLVDRKGMEVHLVGDKRIFSDKSSPTDFLVIHFDCVLRLFAKDHLVQQRRQRASGRCQGGN